MFPIALIHDYESSMQLARFRNASLWRVNDSTPRTSTTPSSLHGIAARWRPCCQPCTRLAASHNLQQTASFRIRQIHSPPAPNYKPRVVTPRRKLRPTFRPHGEQNEPNDLSTDGQSARAPVIDPLASYSSPPIRLIGVTDEKKNLRSRSKTSVEALEKELMWIAYNDPHPEPIQNILRFLIREHHKRPKPEYYEALILGHCNDRHGSISAVREILKEMEDYHIEFTATALLGVLKVQTSLLIC